MTKIKTSKPLTKDVLIDALAEFFHGRLKPEFDRITKRFDKVENRLDGVENKLSRVEVELMGTKDEIQGLKVDLSDTPTRRGFEKLKTKVYRHHPSN